jgi:hypothetical protein
MGWAIFSQTHLVTLATFFSCGTSFVKIYDVETTPEAASTLSPLHANHEVSWHHSKP